MNLKLPLILIKGNFKPGRTLPYAPPEIINNFRYKYHKRVDVFSLGVLMCDILFDEYPVELKRGNLY